MKFTWHRRALREFNDAFDEMYASRPEPALEWRLDVRHMMSMLEHYPQIGPLLHHDPDGEIRQCIVGRYRFIYRYDGAVLEMRRIRHVRRDYDPQTIRDGTAHFRAFVV